MLGVAIHKLINRENIIFKEGRETQAWFLKGGGTLLPFLVDFMYFWLRDLGLYACVCVRTCTRV